MSYNQVTNEEAAHYMWLLSQDPEQIKNFLELASGDHIQELKEKLHQKTLQTRSMDALAMYVNSMGRINVTPRVFLDPIPKSAVRSTYNGVTMRIRANLWIDNTHIGEMYFSSGFSTHRWKEVYTTAEEYDQIRLLVYVQLLERYLLFLTLEVLQDLNEFELWVSRIYSLEDSVKSIGLPVPCDLASITGKIQGYLYNLVKEGVGYGKTIPTDVIEALLHHSERLQLSSIEVFPDGLVIHIPDKKKTSYIIFEKHEKGYVRKNKSSIIHKRLELRDKLMK